MDKGEIKHEKRKREKRERRRREKRERRKRDERERDESCERVYKRFRNEKDVGT